jgi:hypothetical protein
MHAGDASAPRAAEETEDAPVAPLPSESVAVHATHASNLAAAAVDRDTVCGVSSPRVASSLGGSMAGGTLHEAATGTLHEAYHILRNYL